MPEDERIAMLSEGLVRELLTAGKTVATAESCTGGWVAKSITDISGSSQCFAYGIVSYSNDAKESILGVKPATLAKHGAVSENTVREMAQGVLRLSGADMSVAISGIAGPDGGSEEKPLGTVWFGWSTRQNGKIETDVLRRQLDGDREDVRSESVIIALQELRLRLARISEGRTA
jgi:nicotinamide-nucleotide amidase